MGIFRIREMMEKNMLLWTIRVRTRLLILVVGLCCVVAGVGFAGVWGGATARTALDEIRQDRVTPIILLKQIGQSYHQLVDQVNRFDSGQASAAETEAAMTALRESAAADWQKARPWFRSADELAAADAYDAQVFTAAQKIDWLVEAIRGGDAEMVNRFNRDYLYPTVSELTALLDGMERQHLAAMTAAYDAYEAVYDLVLMLVIGGGVAGCLVGGGFGGLVIASVQRPLRSLQQSVAGLAAGDLSTPEAVVGRRNEFVPLVRGLEAWRLAMRAEAAHQEAEQLAAKRQQDRQRALETAIEGFDHSIAEVADALRAAVGGMRASADGLVRNAEQAQARTGDAAEHIGQTVGSLETISAASSELSASIAEVSRQAHETATLADQAVQDVMQVSTRVEQLAEVTGRINTAVGLIGDIAARTNMLALNATIESARAGALGKGFAVVAGEVKGLAGQTSAATQEISGLIEAVQRETAFVVSAIDGVSGIIHRISRHATATAGAAEQQDTATAEISRSVTEASGRTRDLNERVQDISQAAQETGSMALQVFSAADSLVQRRRILDDAVSSFLVTVRDDPETAEASPEADVPGVGDHDVAA